MSLIDVTGLTFAYEGGHDNIFENATFRLDTEWRLGFTGRNGRGKTTFLQLLMGRLEYRGTISASVRFEYFPYPVTAPHLSARQVALDHSGGAQGWEIDRELSLLAVRPEALDRPFCTLSQGEQTKVLLAALFLRENAFLLIDEPTNHLDLDARKQVAAYLKSKRGFILVSHDRAFLDESVDHILSINRADIQVQRGNFSSWLENKERQDGYEQAENGRLHKDIKRLRQAAARTASWSGKAEAGKHNTRNSGLRPDRGYVGHKAAKMMKRSKSIENRRLAAAEQKSGLLKNVEEADRLFLSPLTYHSRRLLSLERVAIDYGGGPVCREISFSLEAGERLALVGRNGAGKSSLLGLLAGAPVPHTGRVDTGKGLVISVVSQSATQLCGSLSDYAGQQNIDESLFKAILRKLDFSRPQLEKDMADFSQGQKKKTLIAASLCTPAHLYLWDEPLNYIDVLSRMQIEQLLLDSGATIVFVEHDQCFAQRVATRQIQL